MREPSLTQTHEAIERRVFGRTGDRISIIGLGGIVVMNATSREAADHVAEAFERGVNYFDVAPGYGNAEEMLGPALKPYRDRCFLACKTGRRDAAGAEEELHRSLERLQTDHLDLYQLHGLTSLAEVETALGPQGALEVMIKARQAGKVRHLGFSAHSEEAALAALNGFDFDSILFPFNFITWSKGSFGRSLYAKAREKGLGILALKSMARSNWTKDCPEGRRPWNKCWYQPLDEAGPALLALRFTLHLPVTAALPPGHWELFKIALEAAAAGRLTPLSQEEQAVLDGIAAQTEPLAFG